MAGTRVHVSDDPVRIIGVALDDSFFLSFQDGHLLRKTGQVWSKLTKCSTKSRVQSFAISRLDYGNSQLHGFLSGEEAAIGQNKAEQLINLTKKRNHITAVLCKLCWLHVNVCDTHCVSSSAWIGRTVYLWTSKWVSVHKTVGIYLTGWHEKSAWLFDQEITDILVLHNKCTCMQLLKLWSEYVVSLVTNVIFEEWFVHDCIFHYDHHPSCTILNSLKAIDVIVIYAI